MEKESKGSLSETDDKDNDDDGDDDDDDDENNDDDDGDDNLFASHFLFHAKNSIRHYLRIAENS